MKMLFLFHTGRLEASAALAKTLNQTLLDENRTKPLRSFILLTVFLKISLKIKAAIISCF